MLLRPNVSVFRRIVAAMALSVLVGVSVTAQHTPAWAAQYDVIATIPLATATQGYPNGVAFSPDGTKAYVTNHGGNSVSVIDTATYKATGTITGYPTDHQKPAGGGFFTGWNLGLRRQQKQWQRQCHRHRDQRNLKKG